MQLEEQEVLLCLREVGPAEKARLPSAKSRRNELLLIALESASDERVPTKLVFESLKHFLGHVFKPGLVLVFVTDVLLRNVRKNMILMHVEDFVILEQ